MPDINLIHQRHADDPRELPLIVAQEWNFALQHYIQSDGDLYAVQDWIAGLASASARKASEMWRQMDVTQLRISITQLPYTATNGKIYQMDFTDQHGLYAIAAHMRATKSRTALAEVKDYLALAGVFGDEMRRNTERAQRFIEARVKGIVKRKTFTQAARDTHRTGQPAYGRLTDTEYQVLFGAAKRELVKVLELSPAQAEKFRDHISELAIKAVDAVETAAGMKFQQMGGSLATEEQIEIVQTAARLLSPGFTAIAQYLGVDLLSGKRLIGGGK